MVRLPLGVLLLSFSLKATQNVQNKYFQKRCDFNKDEHRIIFEDFNKASNKEQISLIGSLRITPRTDNHPFIKQLLSQGEGVNRYFLMYGDIMKCYLSYVICKLPLKIDDTSIPPAIYLYKTIIPCSRSESDENGINRAIAQYCTLNNINILGLLYDKNDTVRPGATIVYTDPTESWKIAHIRHQPTVVKPRFVRRPRGINKRRPPTRKIFINPYAPSPTTTVSSISTATDVLLRTPLDNNPNLSTSSSSTTLQHQNECSESSTVPKNAVSMTSDSLLHVHASNSSHCFTTTPSTTPWHQTHRKLIVTGAVATVVIAAAAVYRGNLLSRTPSLATN